MSERNEALKAFDDEALLAEISARELVAKVLHESDEDVFQKEAEDRGYSDTNISDDDCDCDCDGENSFDPREAERAFMALTQSTPAIVRDFVCECAGRIA
jgi:hypothetical protein